MRFTLKESDEDIDAMLILLTLMMAISSSTCQCERSFSGINQQKTKKKVSMIHATLNVIMVMDLWLQNLTQNGLLIAGLVGENVG